MITNFKLYESINQDSPEIGDYIVCKGKLNGLGDFYNFVNDKIGQIISINVQDKHNNPHLINYKVDYGEIPNKLYRFIFNIYLPNRGRVETLNLDTTEIVYWSKNKSELETIIAANKFNI